MEVKWKTSLIPSKAEVHMRDSHWLIYCGTCHEYGNKRESYFQVHQQRKGKNQGTLLSRGIYTIHVLSCWGKTPRHWVGNLIHGIWINFFLLFDSHNNNNFDITLDIIYSFKHSRTKRAVSVTLNMRMHSKLGPS